jgi:tol-pal system protein YbgF
MQSITRVVKIVGIAVSLGIAIPVFAQSAPVYDADSMPQQFENGPGPVDNGPGAGPDQAQDLPPPSPSQDTFVPVQQQAPQQQPISMDAPPASAPHGSTDQRLRRMEQQINNLANNDVAARVDSLQAQIQTLRGQLEQLMHQLAQMQSQQKSMYADLDKRLVSKPVAVSSKQLKSEPDISATQDIGNTDDVPSAVTVVTKPGRKALASKSAKTVKAAAVANNTATDSAGASSDSSATASASNTSSSQPNVAEEQQIYQTAYNLIKAKKYNDAVSALNNMLKKYPSGQFAANAHYWLGELYGLMTKNDQALTEFSTVVKTYPESPRVSDAQLKVGMILASQFKWIDAKSAFKKVINSYPGTASARLAMEQLKQIKQAGH